MAEERGGGEEERRGGRAEGPGSEEYGDGNQQENAEDEADRRVILMSANYLSRQWTDWGLLPISPLRQHNGDHSGTLALGTDGLVQGERVFDQPGRARPVV